jgi:hypothetical protein
MSDRNECFVLRTINPIAYDAGHNYRDPDEFMDKFDNSVVEQFTALARYLLGECEVWVDHWEEEWCDNGYVYALHAADLATRRRLLMPWSAQMSEDSDRCIRNPRLRSSVCVVREYDDD